MYVGLHFGSEKTGKIKIVLDVSKKSVFVRTEVKTYMYAYSSVTK